MSLPNNSISTILLAFLSEIQAKREKLLYGQFKAGFKSNSAAQMSSLIMTCGMFTFIFPSLCIQFLKTN